MEHSVELTGPALQARFAALDQPHVYSADECARMADVVTRIRTLKRARDAVILAHNYQRPEIFEVADFVGDSLELARKGERVDADVIVFCGVHFMAESAKILSPEKTVLLPD